MATTTSGAGTSSRTGKKGTLYRGREGMWSWVAHRITGVLIFFFLFAHVLDAVAAARLAERLQLRHQQL